MYGEHDGRWCATLQAKLIWHLFGALWVRPGERKRRTTTSTKKMVFSHTLMQAQHCGNLLPPCERSAHPHASLQPLCLDGSFIFTLRWSNSCSSLLLNRRRRRRRRPFCSWESGRRPSELYFFLPPKQSSNWGTFSSLALWSVYLACLLSLRDSRTSCLTPVAPADWCSGVAPCGYDDPYLTRSPWARLAHVCPTRWSFWLVSQNDRLWVGPARCKTCDLWPPSIVSDPPPHPPRATTEVEERGTCRVIPHV